LLRLCDSVGERFADEKLGNEEVDAFVMIEMVQRKNIRMREGGDRSGLLLESSLRSRIVRPIGGYNFDRHFPAETRVASAIDLTHSAGAKRRENLVLAEASTYLRP
jgi:hypothetical protein